ncbi:MAG: type II toxin-antitoxin system MqsA family antitoxin [Spirochaetota bacterium]
MNCPVCKVGLLANGYTTVSLSRAESTIVIKGVSAEVCDSCREYALSSDIAAEVSTMAEQAFTNGAEVEVRRFRSQTVASA